MVRLNNGDVLIRMINHANITCQHVTGNQPIIKLNSGTFKSKRDNINASVDVVRLIRRDGYDLYEYLLDQIRNSQWNSFATVTVGEVRNLGFSVKYTPDLNKPYHAEIFPKKGKNNIGKTDSKDLLTKSIWQIRAIGI